MKNIDETRNYLIKQIKQNELMSRKYKKICATLNYNEHILFLASTSTVCISISGSMFLKISSIWAWNVS